jgi:hypothetical protein
LAKCDSTYCARRHPPRGLFDSREQFAIPVRLSAFSGIGASSVDARSLTASPLWLSGK